jgi:hypothetical protein
VSIENSGTRRIKSRFESIDIVHTSVVLFEDFGTHRPARRAPSCENCTPPQDSSNCAH